MASYRKPAIAVLAVSICLIAVVGYFALTRDAPQRFDSCEISDDLLVLTFTYGAGDRPAVSFDPGPDGIQVDWRRNSTGGAHEDIGLAGEARFANFGNRGPVTYRDGTQLACAGAQPTLER